MKISYNWLKKYIKTKLSPEEISNILTATGLEVEGIEEIESIKGSLNGIVVGEVLECEKHPNADKLKITKVNLGANEPLQIVCGAANVAAGQKVPVATIGTQLYAPNGEKFTIKKGKIRGEESHGMICAEDEIGLGKGHEGILVLNPELTPGTPLSEIYDISTDYCLEIGLTPNRTDAMSHYGVARDLYAALAIKGIEAEWIGASINDFNLDKKVESPITVKVEDFNLCPRYSGIYIKNVTIKPSPTWLQNKLKVIGLSPINNVVDSTNYILHSYGLPLHAFDADKIKGNEIRIGTVSEGTTFTTLDGISRTLNSTELLIKDKENTPLCLAGIYGGKDSGINSETKNIFLESAYFNPISIRKTSKKEGLNTDASFRYERGADPNITIFALKKCAELIKETTQGILVGPIIDEYPNAIKPIEVTLRYKKIKQVLGTSIEKNLIKNILKFLEFSILKEDQDSLVLDVPTYRVDVTREIDIIEEIARIYGYDHIEIPTKFSFAYENKNVFDKEGLEHKIASQLKSQGFYEVLNNSLTKKRGSATNYVELLNPLSNELSVMRQNLIYGILENISFNFNRNQKEIKIFEFGKSYFKTETGYTEKKKLGLALLGDYFTNNWISKNNQTTFYHLKGVVNLILDNFNIQIIEEPFTQELFKESIEIFDSKNNISLGILGIISTNLLKEYGIKQDVFYSELNWNFLEKTAANKPKYLLQDIPKFPGAYRDLSLLIDTTIPYKDLYQAAFETDKKILKSVNLFDVYEAKNLPEGKKSYALSFFLQDEKKTLTDKDIDKTMTKLINKFQTDFNAELRN